MYVLSVNGRKMGLKWDWNGIKTGQKQGWGTEGNELNLIGFLKNHKENLVLKTGTFKKEGCLKWPAEYFANIKYYLLISKKINRFFWSVLLSLWFSL